VLGRSANFRVEPVPQPCPPAIRFAGPKTVEDTHRDLVQDCHENLYPDFDRDRHAHPNAAR